MLRQVSLELVSENLLQDAAKQHGVSLTVVDCKSFNKTGMVLLLELEGPAPAVSEAAHAIRRTPGVRQAIEGKGHGDVVPLLVVLDRPTFCQTSIDAAVICLDCPLNSPSQPATWRFLIRRAEDLRMILSKLERVGVGARIVGISPLDHKELLTRRQREIMSIAVSSGYFEFPRGISLTDLSALVQVKPSTLSEILRSAERKIMENAVEVPLVGSH